MRELTSIIAQRLLNLYRQAHVIEGGWAVVNKALLAEADNEVMADLQKLPNGEKLVQHIKNLKSGKTEMNGIERGFIPYGGMMDSAVKATQISNKDLKELESVLAEFQSDEEHIEKIKNLTFVQSFGEKWISGVRASLSGKPELEKKWVEVSQSARAYDLWNKAYAILIPPVSERARAEIQAELSEYETYLPMFGEDGMQLLSRLRSFVSSL